MTERTTDRLVFSSANRQKVVADFRGGQLSSDAGALLLREADRRLQLTGKLAAALHDRRDKSKVTHDLQSMLAQRIFGIALGYEDGNDHQTLRYDPVFALLADHRPNDKPLASPPTLCSFENDRDRASLWRMSAILVDTFIASHDAPPKEIILDFDATDDVVHGGQQGRFFHGYYDHYCFLPLYVFCDDHLLAAYLRPSNIDAAFHSRAVLKLLVKRIRTAWPETRIILRADSGFCRWRVMRWCDRHDIGYVLGLARNKVLERLAAPFMQTAQEVYQNTQEKQRHFHEISYAAQTWDRQRRVVVKAEHLQQGSNVRFVVTNLPGDPADLYDHFYCQRGDMENRIKEQQLQLFADRTSCHNFLSNQFRLLLASAAYALVNHIRRVALVGTELAQAEVATIRVKLLKIAARVVISVRRVVFHFCSNYPYQQLLQHITARLVPQ